MYCNNMENNNSGFCAACTNDEAQALWGLEVIDVAEVFVIFDGVNSLEVGVECYLDGHEGVGAVCVCKHPFVSC